MNTPTASATHLYRHESRSVAIIGAGMSGLAAAHTLHDAGYNVTLFEKSRSVSGRAATRRQAGFIYDHGAQYIKSGHASSVELITERFRLPDLIDIAKPVWIFDGAGHIQEGDEQQNAEPKWSYRSGLTALAKAMSQGLDVRLETPIQRIAQTENGWQLFTASGQAAGPFAHTLVTLPPPQARELIQASQLIHDLSEIILSHLAVSHYNPLLSLMLGYRPRPQPRPYYALVNTDKAHLISWLAWEHEKAPERAPSDAGLLIAQMAPGYSEERWQIPPDELYRDVARHVSTLIAEDLPSPFFHDVQPWRYALPSAKADGDALNTLTLPYRLAFCGDGFTGGRVHLAIEDGIAVAHKIIGS